MVAVAGQEASTPENDPGSPAGDQAVALTQEPDARRYRPDHGSAPPAGDGVYTYDSSVNFVASAADGGRGFSTLRGAGVQTSAPSGTRALPAGPRPAGELPPADVVVIGKFDPATNEIRATFRPGERSLLSQLPNQGSAPGNYVQNSRVLRTEMQRGVPIRDAEVNPISGELANNTGFLRLERDILQQRQWRFDSKSGYWMPPSG